MTRWRKCYCPTTGVLRGVIWFEDGWWHAETPTAWSHLNYLTEAAAESSLLDTDHGGLLGRDRADTAANTRAKAA